MGKLKVWRVYNGYTGASAVHVIVCAATEERARELASEEFKRKAHRPHPWQEGVIEQLYPEQYWTDLVEVEELGSATDEWALEGDS